MIVKSHTEDSVNLVNLYEGAQFTISMTSDKLYCPNRWLPDEALGLYNPEQAKKDGEAYMRGFAACGISI